MTDSVDGIVGVLGPSVSFSDESFVEGDMSVYFPCCKFKVEFVDASFKEVFTHYTVHAVQSG